MLNFNFAIYFFLSVSFCVLCILPNSVSAKEIIIQNNPLTNEYVINQTIYVGPDDVLRIVAGTNIRAGNSASIYAKGLVFVGADSVGIDSLIDSAPVNIVSDSMAPFFQIDGGQMIVIQTNYTGHSLVEGYRGAQIEFTGLTFNLPDIYPQSLNYNLRPIISVFSSSSIDISYSQFDVVFNGLLDHDLIDGNELVSNSDFFSSSVIEIFGSSSLKFHNSSIRSDHANTVIAGYRESVLNFDRVSIYSCDRWLMVYQGSSADGNINIPDCTAEAQMVFDNSTSTVTFMDTKCCSSVIFLPGLQASRLYKKQIFENQLWEPNRERDVERLYMNTQGNSVNSGIYTRDIIHTTNIVGEVFGFSIYKNFIKTLASLQSQKLITEYSEWPYDWRLAPSDIVDDKLLAEFIRLSAKSYTGKVSIVAHSYGGIVAKELVHDLKKMNKSHLIDQLILVATPESGAAPTIFSIVHGYIDSLAMKIIADPITWFRFAQNLPSLYHLLPTEIYKSGLNSYFKFAKNSVSTTISLQKNNESDNIIKKLSDEINNRLSPHMSTTTFALRGNRLRSVTKQIPLAVGSFIFSTSSNQSLHASVQNYNRSMKITNDWIKRRSKTWSIIGTGIPTMEGMSYEFHPCIEFYCKDAGIFIGMPIQNFKGDGTIIFDSAENRSGKLLYIDLHKINKDSKTNYSHANILEVPYIQETIKQILILGETVNSNGNIYIGNNINTQSLIGSSLNTLAIKGDVSGGLSFNDQGKVTETKIVNNNFGHIYDIQNIPNSSISKIGEITYISSVTKPAQISLISDRVQKISLYYSNSGLGLETGISPGNENNDNDVEDSGNNDDSGNGVDISNNNNGNSDGNYNASTSASAPSEIGMHTVNNEIFKIEHIPVVLGSLIQINDISSSNIVVVVQHPVTGSGYVNASTSTMPSASSTSDLGQNNQQGNSDNNHNTQNTPELYYFSTSSSNTNTNSTNYMNSISTGELNLIQRDMIALKQAVDKSMYTTLGLQTHAYQQYFSRDLTRLQISFQKIIDRLLNTNLFLSTIEKQAMWNSYNIVRDNVSLLIEYDIFYLNLFRVNRINNEKQLDIKKRRVDISVAYLEFVRLERRILEFIQKHDSIPRERLQRP